MCKHEDPTDVTSIRRNAKQRCRQHRTIRLADGHAWPRRSAFGICDDECCSSFGRAFARSLGRPCDTGELKAAHIRVIRIAYQKNLMITEH
jgi:hypothetical protein